MKIFLTLFLLVSFAFFLSCQSQIEKLGDFKILPLPQQFEINGVSKLYSDDILRYYTDENVNLGAVNLLNNIRCGVSFLKGLIILIKDRSLNFPIT